MAGEAGFSGTDSVVYDNNFRYQVNVNIISSTADATAYSERLTLLTGPDVNRTVSHVETLLRSNDAINLKRAEIEVGPRIVGLISKDILVSGGLVDAAKDGIGLEGAGIVRNSGPDVRNFKIDDRQ
ncbi:MAG: hypothetical protein LQ337_002925 [Flavoplaca oasis]|nr:MAG: hypothetical protein LQ337_002925 [Flavoplaca oasis]